MFFYVAKLAWFVLQPSSLLVLSAVAALTALTLRRQATARRFLLVTVAIGLAGMSPLGNLLILPLEQRFERASLDGRPIRGIVILGGGEEAEVATARGAHALNEAGERISEAVALSLRLPQARIVFSGGSARLVPGASSEAAAVAFMLTGMGVSPDRLILEDRSRDTFENAVYVREIVKPAAGERWLLVTSASHMPRAMGTFRKAGFPVEPWPVDYRTRGWSDAGQVFYTPSDGLRRLDLVAKEYLGLVAYWLSGRSDALWPGP